MGGVASPLVRAAVDTSPRSSCTPASSCLAEAGVGSSLSQVEVM